MSTPTDPKHEFLLGEFALLSINAAFATRNRHRLIYAESATHRQRVIAKILIHRTLSDVAVTYTATSVSELEHFSKIEQTSNRLSDELTSTLFGSRFRIGIAQKLINLYLKYLWSSGFCQEPPHCPIDGIIRRIAGISYNWTGSDSIEDYKNAIDELRKVAGGRSLAVWELEEYSWRQVSPKDAGDTPL